VQNPSSFSLLLKLDFEDAKEKEEEGVVFQVKTCKRVVVLSALV